MTTNDGDNFLTHERLNGAPDILIDKHGDAWFRTRYGNYSILGTGDGMARSRVEEMWGPVTEAWR